MSAAPGLNLAEALEAQRGALAAQAQQVYDVWVEDGRGICGAIAVAFAELLTDSLEPAVDVFVLDLDGPDGEPPHTLCLAENDSECFSIDLPYELYEEGRREGGRWAWSRKADVLFAADDIVIAPA